MSFSAFNLVASYLHCPSVHCSAHRLLTDHIYMCSRSTGRATRRLSGFRHQKTSRMTHGTDALSTPCSCVTSVVVFLYHSLFTSIPSHIRTCACVFGSRDFSDIGAGGIPLANLKDFRAGTKIASCFAPGCEGRGVLFATYVVLDLAQK